MTYFLSFGMIFTFTIIGYILLRWGNYKCYGNTPVNLFVFLSILFTSGLDVGLIMFPLTEFAIYSNPENAASYGFTNPLSIEMGFWGLLVWSFYFLTTFYFAVIEPKIKFFEIYIVKLIHNIVIITTCSFTAYLFLVNLSWYLPDISSDYLITLSAFLSKGINLNSEVVELKTAFYGIVLITILFSVISSTNIRYVKILSVTSLFLFFSLAFALWIYDLYSSGTTSVLQNVQQLYTGYFANIHKFILPFNEYHQFYLFWWFAWSIIIGQFTARFISGLRTWQLFLAIIIIPSIPMALWFSVLYSLYTSETPITPMINNIMVLIGTIFVINSLDSLIRLYTVNLNFTKTKLSTIGYICINTILLFSLTILFKANIINIEYVGALVIIMYIMCFMYILKKKKYLTRLR